MNHEWQQDNQTCLPLRIHSFFPNSIYVHCAHEIPEFIQNPSSECKFRLSFRDSQRDTDIDSADNIRNQPRDSSQFTRLNCCVTKNIKRIKNIRMNGHHCIILSSKYSSRSSYFSSTKMCMQICFLPDVSLHITSPHLFNLRCNHNESMYSHSMLLLLLLWRIQQAHKAAYIKTTSAPLFDEEWTNRILTSERGWCCSQYLRDTRVVVCCRSI